MQTPSGHAGVFRTVSVMRDLISKFRTNDEILRAAIALIFLIPSKDELGEVNAIFDFVRDNIRYTRDVLGIETLATPVITLNRKVGDCDDKATLFCSLCEAVGYPTRLVMAGYNDPKAYEHIYAQVFVNNKWINADTTEDYSLGYAPPNPLIIWFER